MKDEYDRERILRRQRAHSIKNSKLNAKHECGFKGAGPGCQRNFMSNKEQFHFDLRKFPKKKFKNYRNLHLKHDEPMRLGYAGHKGSHMYCTIGKFQKYMPNPLQVIKRKPAPASSQRAFKNGSPANTWKPSPSVSLFKRNLARSTRR